MILPRDAMHNRGLCLRAVFVGLCVCLSVTLMESVKTNNRTKSYTQVCSPSNSQTIVVFFIVFTYQTLWRYSNGNPVTKASNVGGVL